MNQMIQRVYKCFFIVLPAALLLMLLPQVVQAAGDPVSGEQRMSDICHATSIACSGDTTILMDCDITESGLVSSLVMINAQGYDLVIKNTGDERHTLTLSSNGSLIKAKNLTVEGIDLVLKNPESYDETAIETTEKMVFKDVNLDADLNTGNSPAFLAGYDLILQDCGNVKIRSNGNDFGLHAKGDFSGGKWTGGELRISNSGVDIQSEYGLCAERGAILTAVKGEINSSSGGIESNTELVLSESELKLITSGNKALQSEENMDIIRSKLDIEAHTFFAVNTYKKMNIDESSIAIRSDYNALEGKGITITRSDLAIDAASGMALRSDGSEGIILKEVTGTAASGKDGIYSEEDVLFDGCDLTVKGGTQAILCWKGTPKFAENNWLRNLPGYKLITKEIDGSDHNIIADAGGTEAKQVEIARKRLTDSFCTMTVADQTYTGSALTPSPVIKWNGTTLVSGTDYTVSYKNNVKAGTAEITVTGKGNYVGSKVLHFTIKPENKKPEDKAAGAVVKGRTYTVKTLKYKVTNADMKGRGTVTLTGTTQKKTKLSKLKVPKTVKINGAVFKVTSIGNKAFNKYKKIKSVTIGDHVKSIGTSAFAGNKALTKVTIGKGVTRIGASAFSGDKKLKNIRIKSAKLKSVKKNAMKGIHKKAVIKVPKKQLKKYKKLFSSKTGFQKSMMVKK